MPNDKFNTHLIVGFILQIMAPPVSNPTLLTLARLNQYLEISSSRPNPYIIFFPFNITFPKLGYHFEIFYWAWALPLRNLVPVAPYLFKYYFSWVTLSKPLHHDPLKSHSPSPTPYKSSSCSRTFLKFLPLPHPTTHCQNRFLLFVCQVNFPTY